jgi:hypothetical protein
VTIEVGPSIDVREPLATLVLATISGRVPVRNSVFSPTIA